MLSTKVVRANAASPSGAGSAVTGRGCWIALASSAEMPLVTSDRRATETSVIGLPPSSDLDPGSHSRFAGFQTRLGPVDGGSLCCRRRGEVAEWLKAAVSKTVMGGSVHRGFESLP